jgi:rhodanese-related sulfurtransferase
MRHESLASFLTVSWFALFSAATQGMTVTGLQQQLTQGEKVTVIDIRTPVLFARGHIPNAINVPASLCAQRKLPPLGKVVVCGEGLGRETTDGAVAALTLKPGLTVDVLEGGLAAWESAHLPTSKSRGLEPEAPNYITYAELKAAKIADVVLVDLRSQPLATPDASAVAPASVSAPLTDLNQEFPDMPLTKSAFDLPQSRTFSRSGPPTPPLLVLIDNGDGKAQAMARTLEANGIKRYVILAGGELILARRGEPGMKRNGPGSPALRQTTTHINPASH